MYLLRLLLLVAAFHPITARQPYAPKPVNGTCAPGNYIQHTFANITCRPCDAGQYSPGNQSYCKICPAGSAAPNLGSASCGLCPINTFGIPSRRACVSCSNPAVNVWADGSGRGWITARPGSTSFADCYDLDVAMFYGWFFFIFAVVFFSVVLLDGYVHKVALFRNLRATQACARVMYALRKDVGAVLDNILQDEVDEEVQAVEKSGSVLAFLDDKVRAPRVTVVYAIICPLSCHPLYFLPYLAPDPYIFPTYPTLTPL